jgi:hypothetical protein
MALHLAAIAAFAVNMVEPKVVNPLVIEQASHSASSSVHGSDAAAHAVFFCGTDRR